MPRDLIEQAVAIWDDPRHCLPFIKGRVALYAILRTLEVGAGDEVLIPGFTCVVVPAAVVYLGATPVYYDIDPATLQGDPARAAAAITRRTRAVLVQHNFGTPAPLGDLAATCRDRGIALVEDCAHALGASLGRQPVGTLGDAAFCSLQWSKPTTTGLGGIARFGVAELASRCRELVRREFAEPPLLQSIYLSMLASLFRSWYRPQWYWLAQDVYRWAGHRGLVQGSSAPRELAAAVMPPGYKCRFGSVRTTSLRAALAGLPDLVRHRRRILAHYAERFAAQGIWLPPAPEADAVAVALRYPLLVENRGELLRRARQARIEIGDWFNAPLHPQGACAEAFGYRPGDCPLGEAAAARVINLPTHRRVDFDAADRIIDFVGAQARCLDPVSWPPGASRTAPKPRATSD